MAREVEAVVVVVVAEVEHWVMTKPDVDWPEKVITFKANARFPQNVPGINRAARHGLRDCMALRETAISSDRRGIQKQM